MTAGAILSPNPVALFQGEWATGIMLNCNVYQTCTTGCRYCYAALNRAAEGLRHAQVPVADPSTDFSGV